MENIIQYGGDIVLYSNNDIKKSLVYAILLSIALVLALIFNKGVMFYLVQYQSIIDFILLYAALTISTGYLWGNFFFKRMMR